MNGRLIKLSLAISLVLATLSCQKRELAPPDNPELKGESKARLQVEMQIKRLQRESIYRGNCELYRLSLQETRSIVRGAAIHITDDLFKSKVDLIFQKHADVIFLLDNMRPTTDKPVAIAAYKKYILTKSEHAEYNSIIAEPFLIVLEDVNIEIESASQDLAQSLLKLQALYFYLDSEDAPPTSLALSEKTIGQGVVHYQTRIDYLSQRANWLRGPLKSRILHLKKMVEGFEEAQLLASRKRDLEKQKQRLYIESLKPKHAKTLFDILDWCVFTTGQPMRDAMKSGFVDHDAVRRLSCEVIWRDCRIK